jgi:hypothetical protein
MRARLFFLVYRENFDDQSTSRNVLNKYQILHGAVGALSKAGYLTETQKIRLLLFIIGEEAWNIHETITYENSAEEITLEEVLGKFYYYFVPRVNIIYEHYMFFLFCTTGRWKCPFF